MNYKTEKTILNNRNLTVHKYTFINLQFMKILLFKNFNQALIIKSFPIQILFPLLSNHYINNATKKLSKIQTLRKLYC